MKTLLLVICLSAPVMSYVEFMSDYGYLTNYDENIYINEPQTKSTTSYHITKVLMLSEHYHENINELKFQYIYYQFEKNTIKINYDWFVYFCNVDRDTKFEMIDKILQYL